MQPLHTKLPKQQRWLALSNGWFKLNVDGAVRVEDCVGEAMGDSRCDMGFYGSMSFQGATSSIQVKLLALREGLMLARRVGYTELQVETDSFEAVNACNGDLIDFSIIGFIIADVKELASQFCGCSISYFPCSCNGVAHCLAKLSSSNGSDVVCFKESPDAIWDILNQDMLPP